jgi:hypothetical protein
MFLHKNKNDKLIYLEYFQIYKYILLILIFLKKK